jgi:glycosyltransferase involved in cell wall biosynthesis
MKILLVHNYYQQHGGERVAVENQVALLREWGHEVIVYARDSSRILDYGTIEKILFFPRTVFPRRTLREIKAVVRDRRPDVAHVHNVLPLISPLAYWALHDTGVPIVQTVHNFRFLCPNGLFYTQGEICERCKYGTTLPAVRRRCYRESYSLSALYAFTIGLYRRRGTFQLIDRFIALTEFTAQKLVESGLAEQDKIVVLGNFLPNPLPVPGSFEERESYVVYLGRLSPEKGVDVLLDAMVDLPGLELRIVGDGPQMERLQAIKREKSLSQAKFLGRVVGEEKWCLLRRARGTVVPSACYETFNLSALESLAVGTPVLVSNLGSLSYIVEDGKDGLLFCPGDSQDLRRKLAWLVEHPEAASTMGQHGRQVVEKQYSAEAHYERLMAVYHEVAR